MGAAAAQTRLRAGWDRPEAQGGRATRARRGGGSGGAEGSGQGYVGAVGEGVPQHSRWVAAGGGESERTHAAWAEVRD